MSSGTNTSEPKKLTENSVLQSLFSTPESVFRTPIVLVSYDGDVVVKEKIKVMRYDHKIDNQEATPKLNILFAFSLPKYEVIKEGIKFNESVGSQQLKPIQKISDRPFVVEEKAYKLGNGKDVRIVMRTGHVLSGKQTYYTKYNLVLQIHGMTVLVYKHGILEYGTV